MLLAIPAILLISMKFMVFANPLQTPVEVLPSVPPIPIPVRHEPCKQWVVYKGVMFDNVKDYESFKTSGIIPLEALN